MSQQKIEPTAKAYVSELFRLIHEAEGVLDGVI